MINFNSSVSIEPEAFTEAKASSDSKKSVKGIIDDILKSTEDKAKANKVGKAVRDGSKAIGKAETTLSDQVLDRRSIIARASNSVMQFPIYITQSNRIAEAHTIGKAFERVYASFVQNVIAQNPVITDISKVNGLKFLRDYHTNIKESSALTVEEFQSIFNEYCEPIDQFDEIMTEAVINELKLPGGTVTFMAARPNAMIALESERLSHEPLDGFRYLAEASVPQGKQVSKQKQVMIETQGKEIELVSEVLMNGLTEHLTNLGLAAKAKAEGWDVAQKAAEIRNFIQDKGIYRTSTGKTYRYADGKYLYAIPSVKSADTDSSKPDPMTPAVDPPMLLKDTDVKKLNSMQPFQFIVKFRVNPVYGKDNEVQPGTNYEQSYILGVKTVLHVIKIKDLSDDLKDIITGERKGLQKVRYKTGEISWLKDYLLNLPGLKADAAKGLDDRRWLSTLKRLGEYEHLHGTAFKKPLSAIYDNGIPIPNATLVVTRGDVERMKDETGINIETISTARTLAKRLFLIAVVIVDQTAGSYKVFFPDMDNDWDVQSLGSLDAEIARIDNSPLMNEINRISRKG